MQMIFAIRHLLRGYSGVRPPQEAIERRGYRKGYASLHNKVCFEGCAHETT